MLAKKPPMGWNSWNTFAENVNEEIVMKTTDIIIDKGYRDCGYEYVVIDDCWSLRERDENGLLVADPKKFPHGMKYVADYVHSKGLKFGIYSCAGVRTCADYPGSYGHEYTDAKTFAQWGVDFLKYDFCHFPSSGNCKNAYLTMGLALRNSGRDILYSACNWGVEDPARWMRSVGAHMYRSTGDIFDNYKSMKDIFLSQMNNFGGSAPGCFNDIDMLTVGMYGKGHVGIESGCTDIEYKTHFALWCMFGAPLMIGGDIRNMNPYCEELLKNKYLIEINQDEECRTPYELNSNAHGGDAKSFLKILSGNRVALGFFNLNEDKTSIPMHFEEAGIPYSENLGLELTNAFTGENIGIKRDYFRVDLEGHDCVIYIAEFKEV